jgi:hypothetical protein
VGNDFVDAGLDPLTRDDFSVPADTVLYSDLLAAGFPGGIRADLTPVGGLGVVAEPSGTDQVVVTEALSIVGTRTADVLIGSPYLDVLIGRGGADRIDGAGTDWIALGQAGGTARGGEDTDHLEAHPATGPAVLRGQDGDDQLWVRAVEDVEVDGGRGHDDIDLRLTPASRDVSVDGGSARDLVTFDVRKAGFGKGTTITVDLDRGVLRTEARAGRGRAGRVRGLEVLWIKGEDASCREDAAWRPRCAAAATPSSPPGGRTSWTWATVATTSRTAAWGGTPASAPSGSGAART